ncbi:LytR/AlgR family response regulator transcription factor [Cupriavidus metallidurans]|uniref:LytR/AlgR family response regulator transcription factor n=1 Tax=Cupriavidus metallidurans TaxID=119219 RepID=UPI003CFEEA5B
MSPTLLIADDEPLLARVLESELKALWPEAQIVAVVHDGVAALEATRDQQPDVAFLDIRMPGMSGMDVARELIEFDRPPLVVFVTAYDQFALEAFERTAVDYVLKPVQHERLEATVGRLKARMAARTEAEEEGDADTDIGSMVDTDRLGQLLQRLEMLERPTQARGQYLRFIKALVGQEVRIIPVDEVVYLEATDKYVNVVSSNGEALIRTSLRELMQQLDPDRFWQIHRGTVVNIDCVASAATQSLGRLSLKLRNRPESLAVARQYAHLFKQM